MYLLSGQAVGPPAMADLVIFRRDMTSDKQNTRDRGGREGEVRAEYGRGVCQRTFDFWWVPMSPYSVPLHLNINDLTWRKYYHFSIDRYLFLAIFAPEVTRDSLPSKNFKLNFLLISFTFF